ncbi:hypothetical protein [Trichocoleus sp. FACHB-591]|uniref:hypothetical protein n=1 Tax=Trichocoleus sp. FACHB-591 TaxID=2692872 RepID=UPI00168725C2|nr:hypothetical protein [Trichocoleus sp. FACHB-591]
MSVSLLCKSTTLTQGATIKNGFNYTAPTALSNPSDLTNATTLTSSARQVSGLLRSAHNVIHTRRLISLVLLPLV